MANTPKHNLCNEQIEDEIYVVLELDDGTKIRLTCLDGASANFVAYATITGAEITLGEFTDYGRL